MLSLPCQFNSNNMKKGVGVILLCVLALFLTMNSCKYEKDNNEEATEDITLDGAIDALDRACKSGNKEEAVSAYEVMLRIILDETVKNAYAGNYTERSVINAEQEKRLEEISKECDCISDKEIEEITMKVESEY